MATDLTDVLINRQMAKYNPDQFGRRPDLISDAGGNWNAGSNQQLISQGLGNILGAIDAPAQREAMARQEAMAAEQIQYDRGQADLTNQLNQRTADRQDARLSMDKATAARAVERDRKADLASTAQNEFQAFTYKAGDGLRSAIEGNKTAIADLTGSGVLITNDDGTFSLADSATEDQKKTFSNIKDIDSLIRDARNGILEYVAGKAGDDIAGNEITDIQQGLSMLESAYKPSTQATQAETDLYNRRVGILNSQRDEKLRDTTRAVGSNPELLSIQSDIASMPSGKPGELAPSLVMDAIKNNPTLDQKDAYKEVESFVNKAKAGDHGKRLQKLLKDDVDGWGQYSLAKAIRDTAGDRRWHEWGVGDFLSSALRERILNNANSINQVRNVVKRQGEITTQHAAELLKLDQLFNSATSGRATTN